MKYMINECVPLNSKGQNANIKVNILTDEEMRELGFTDYREGFWYYCKSVGDSKTFKVTFNMTINKKTKEVEICVLDEFSLQPYDFQILMGSNTLANNVYDDVQDLMKHFIDKGIIYGYTLGDYI